MNPGQFYSNRYSIKFCTAAAVFTTIFVTATVYNSQVFAAPVSKDAAKQAETTMKDTIQTTMTIPSDGPMYIGDDVGYVFIKPNAADLDKDPLVFRYVLGANYKVAEHHGGQGQGLAVNFTDYRDGGFICSEAGSAYNLARLIGHQQKQLITKIKQATYESKYISSHSGAGTYTGSLTTLCFQPRGMNEVNWSTECSASVDKFVNKAKSKNDQSIKNFISMGALPNQWNFSTPKNYHALPAKGGFDKKIFPDNNSAESRCYTRYEIVDGMKKLGSWLKKEAETAKEYFKNNGNLSNLRMRNNPYNAYAKKQEKERLKDYRAH